MIVHRLFSQLGSGLAGNISAQSLALLVQLVVALVTIPIFAQLWGLEDYGVWLILFTIPAYVSLADFGFVGAAANAMTASAARGDHASAAAIYRELTGANFMLGLTVLLLVTVALVQGVPGWFAFADGATGGFTALTVLALTAYAVFALWSRALHSALRASGHFAKGAYCIALTALLDVILAAGFAGFGGGLAGAALGYALGQATGLFAMLVLTRRFAPQFLPTIFTASLRRLKALAGPAIALIIIAVGQVILLQGTVVVLGMAAGAAAVPAFTAMRTLARLGVQAVAVINQAVMPELTMARARMDADRSADLVAFNLGIALLLVIPGAIVLALFGSEIVGLWSNGVIQASAALALVMAGILIAGGLWGALASFLTAINQQARFAFPLLIASVAGLAIALPLSISFGASGTALAVLMVEVLMLIWSVRQAQRAGLIDQHMVLSSPRKTISLLRAWLAPAR